MFRSLSLISAVITLVVIVMGAYVRLSDAGLGCPDWPGCYGQSVLSDSEEFRMNAEALYPQHPLDLSKAWKEMGHRYAAGILSLFIVLMFCTSWCVKKHRWFAVLSSVYMLILIGCQAALGMYTVALKTMPIIVTSHLLLGLLTFWSLMWIFWRSRTDISVKPRPHFVLYGVASIVALLLFTQSLLGGWVSSNFAALACADFPTCLGSWLPESADFNSAIHLLHGLETGHTGALTHEGQVAAHWLHRAGALTSLATVLLFTIFCLLAPYSKPIKMAAACLLALVIAQSALGALSILLSLPMAVALVHNAFAALLMLPVVYIGIYARFAPAELKDIQKQPVVESAPASQLIAEAEDVIEQAPQVEEIEAYVEPASESLFRRLKSQLNKTRTGLSGVLSALPFGQQIDEDALEQIETSLIMADVGVEATNDILERLKQRVDQNQIGENESLIDVLKQELNEILAPCSQPLRIPQKEGPFVILVVGVNGAGKTTSIGKLAKRLQAQGHSVMLAAGDTFRAAAVEQLQAWGDRNTIHVVAQHTGADSASVIYDGVQSAQAKGVDVLIADTAGRLHTKSNLMEELSKIKRIMAKLDDTAPHEVLLVLDAGTGQNALSQAQIFNEAVGLTGLALTKLDGTAKGGVIFALANTFSIPIRFIGVGEGIDDLQDFESQQFIDALFTEEE